MNTREREVMDALALALRYSGYGRGQSALNAYDALLAEGSASGDGAEAVAYCDPRDPFNASAFAWPGTERERRHSCALYTNPQPAQVEHEQRSSEGSERPVLERYGIEWRGPHMPIALPMPDGYWTPWHIAEEALKQRTSERRPIADEVVERAEKWVCDHCMDPTIERVILDALTHPRGLPAGSDVRVTDAVVRRFLAWRLPDSFSPDCHIRFDRDGLKNMANGQHWPVGTNLFTYDEAKAMLEHCLKEQRSAT